MVSCFDLLQDEERNPALGFGCRVLDDFFGMGLRTGITELAGEAGCGKTQIALQLLLQAQLPVRLGGLDGSCCFISTEGEVPFGRLKELEQTYKARYAQWGQWDFLSNIYIERVKTLEEQYDVVMKRLPRLIDSLVASRKCNDKKGKPLRLVVIDSMAALFRAEVDSDQYVERAAEVYALAGQLRKLSSVHSFPVLVTNQVTDLFPQALIQYPHLGAWNVLSSARQVVPALGLSWASCVNARLFLSRTRAEHCEDGNLVSGRSVRRTLHIIWAPFLSRGAIDFIVTHDGVTGVAGSAT